MGTFIGALSRDEANEFARLLHPQGPLLTALDKMRLEKSFTYELPASILSKATMHNINQSIRRIQHSSLSHTVTFLDTAEIAPFLRRKILVKDWSRAREFHLRR